MASWWDTNRDGHFDAVEIDRYLLDNGLMPGQPDGYWDDSDDADDEDDFDFYGRRSERDRTDEDDRNDDSWYLDLGYDDPIDYEKGLVHNENRCHECLFWRDDYEDWTRDYGCRIYYTYIADKYPGVDGYSKADADEETCEKFRPQLDHIASCFDCEHFKGDAEELRGTNYCMIVDLYCKIWDKVSGIVADAMYQDSSGNITWSMICPRIKLKKQGGQ